MARPELPWPVMDDGALFLVDDDQLHNFSSREPLSAEVISALQADLGVAVGETVLPIAHWEHDLTGPLSVALNFAGELVVLVVAEKFSEQSSMLATLSTLEQWLAPMDLRDLAGLSGDEARFFEGLREMSAGSTMSLASMLRVLLMNPPFDPDPTEFASVLPFTRVETVRIEAFEATDGTLVVSKTHESPDDRRDRAETGASAEPPITAHLEEAEIETLVEVEPDIDLTEVPPSSEEPSTEWPTILRGSVYVAAELPLHFDPTARSVEPISDELFAVGSHLALVVDIDGHDESPLETSSIFRWASSVGQRRLFDQYRVDASGRGRVVHLFVEGSSRPNRVLYLGVGEQLAQSNLSEPDSLWFKMAPAIDQDRLEQLRAGHIPSSEPAPAFSFASSHVGSMSAHAHSPQHKSNWVPNL